MTVAIGIGFLTTFETLKFTKASIIINEFSSVQNTYSKYITIRFDNKNEYIINSYRCDEIKNENSKNDARNIIINSI